VKEEDGEAIRSREKGGLRNVSTSERGGWVSVEPPTSRKPGLDCAGDRGGASLSARRESRVLPVAVPGTGGGLCNRTQSAKPTTAHISIAPVFGTVCHQ
jgi:hypothetical protein